MHMFVLRCGETGPREDGGKKEVSQLPLVSAAQQTERDVFEA